MEVRIHPTAVVDPTAELGQGVSVGPHAIIEAGVVVGDGTTIGPAVHIGRDTRLGRDNILFGHCAVGSDPQDLTWQGEETFLVMGDRNRVREFVTVNRGTPKGDGYTRIGNDCLLMACCHVAHDCVLGDHVIMANNVLLAGHVTVEDRVILNGATGVQQFTTIGHLAYVGGLTRIVHDVPPFMVVEGNPSKVRKVNTVGLQRHGFSDGQISALKEAHRMVFRSRRPRAQILSEIEASPDLTAEVEDLCRFLRRMERGPRGRSREA